VTAPALAALNFMEYFLANFSGKSSKTYTILILVYGRSIQDSIGLAFDGKFQQFVCIFEDGMSTFVVKSW
jgi:hypothetical protein